MPRFNPNPAQVEAGFFTLIPQSEEYVELKVTGVKAFLDESVDPNKAADKKINYGVAIAFVVAEGQFAGKRVSGVRGYMHTDGAQQFTKGNYIMPLMGFDKTSEAEKEFNTWSETQDWSFDTDTGGTGDAWASLKSRRVKALPGIRVDMKDPANPREFQEWRNFIKV